MPAAHGAVQVEDGLALDERVVTERVVPRVKQKHLYLGAELLQQPRDAAPLLVYVHEDPDVVRHPANDRRSGHAERPTRETG